MTIFSGVIMAVLAIYMIIVLIFPERF
ncbi:MULTISPECIES: potassium-transporting ATPase subunit F [Cysteiniphilum]